METIKEQLSVFTPEQPYAQRSIISVREKGKRYGAQLPEKCLSAVYQVDGDIVTSGCRCDKLMLFSPEGDKWGEIFVELKGANIAHAIEQLEATLQNELFSHPTVTWGKARVVGRDIPRSTGNSVLDRAKIRFQQRFGCDLRAVAPGTTEKIQL